MVYEMGIESVRLHGGCGGQLHRLGQLVIQIPEPSSELG